MCEYCENGELIADDIIFNCCISGNILIIGEEVDGEICEAEINFCPMCGKKLDN